LIDLHCHVLPGIDDGPPTIEASVELCRAACADGTRTMIATPHLNWDYPDVNAAVIHAGVLAVNRALRAVEIDLTVRPGAEVALSRAAEVSDRELHVLRLGGGPYLLVECPWSTGAAGVMNALRMLVDRGYGIVLAHPERSPVLQRPAVLHELVDAGMLCCVSARSLTERGDRRARSAAWELLTGRLAHVIASDSHDTVRRPPQLRSTLERAGLGATQIEYFTREAPAAIIAGAHLAPPPPVDAPRGRMRPGRGRGR
jgi:protein-tyrosine phosphatase